MFFIVKNLRSDYFARRFVEKNFLVTRNEKELKEIGVIVDKINALEKDMVGLSSANLAAKTADFKVRLSKGETLDDILPEAFAVVREAAKRVLGMRHFDVQLIGGCVLHRGKIAENAHW